eukprot:g1037.t1
MTFTFLLLILLSSSSYTVYGLRQAIRPLGVGVAIGGAIQLENNAIEKEFPLSKAQSRVRHHKLKQKELPRVVQNIDKKFDKNTELISFKNENPKLPFFDRIDEDAVATEIERMALEGHAIPHTGRQYHASIFEIEKGLAILFNSAVTYLGPYSDYLPLKQLEIGVDIGEHLVQTVALVQGDFSLIKTKLTKLQECMTNGSSTLEEKERSITEIALALIHLINDINDGVILLEHADKREEEAVQRTKKWLKRAIKALENIADSPRSFMNLLHIFEELESIDILQKDTKKFLTVIGKLMNLSGFDARRDGSLQMTSLASEVDPDAINRSSEEEEWCDGMTIADARKKLDEYKQSKDRGTSKHPFWMDEQEYQAALASGDNEYVNAMTALVQEERALDPLKKAISYKTKGNEFFARGKQSYPVARKCYSLALDLLEDTEEIITLRDQQEKKPSAPRIQIIEEDEQEDEGSKKIIEVQGNTAEDSESDDDEKTSKPAQDPDNQTAQATLKDIQKLRSQTLSNRALINFKLGNFGMCIVDCKDSHKEYATTKVIYRAAMANYKLGKCKYSTRGIRMGRRPLWDFRSIPGFKEPEVIHRENIHNTSEVQEFSVDTKTVCINWCIFITWHEFGHSDVLYTSEDAILSALIRERMFPNEGSNAILPFDRNSEYKSIDDTFLLFPVLDTGSAKELPYSRVKRNSRWPTTREVFKGGDGGNDQTSDERFGSNASNLLNIQATHWVKVPFGLSLLAILQHERLIIPHVPTFYLFSRKSAHWSRFKEHNKLKEWNELF